MIDPSSSEEESDEEQTGVSVFLLFSHSFSPAFLCTFGDNTENQHRHFTLTNTAMRYLLNYRLQEMYADRECSCTWPVDAKNNMNYCTTTKKMNEWMNCFFFSWCFSPRFSTFPFAEASSAWTSSAETSGRWGWKWPWNDRSIIEHFD